MDHGHIFVRKHMSIANSPNLTNEGCLMFFHLTAHVQVVLSYSIFMGSSPAFRCHFSFLSVCFGSCTRSWVSATRPLYLARPTSARATRSSRICWLRKMSRSCNSRNSCCSRNNRLGTQPFTPHQTDKPTLRYSPVLFLTIPPTDTILFQSLSASKLEV